MEINDFVFVDARFIKSIPLENREKILLQVKDFIKAIRDNDYDIRRISKGYSVRHVENTNIYKFRMNDNARVLFTFLPKDADELRSIGIRSEIYDQYELTDGLMLLEYCEHNEAIRRAKRYRNFADRATVMKIHAENTNQDSELEQNFNGWLADRYQAYAYLPEKQIIQIVPDQEFPRLMEMHKSEREFYLNDEQFRILQQPFPVMLFGCAGSGKTTLNAYKLYELSLTGKRIGYFTYSNLLLQDVEDTLGSFLKRRDALDRKKNISFWNITEFFLQNTNTHRVVYYEQFYDWFKKLALGSKYDPFAVWREICGIIKGMINQDWGYDLSYKLDFELVKREMMPIDDYLALGAQFSVFAAGDRAIVYKIAVAYQKWLTKNKLQDINDLSVISMLNGAEKNNHYDYLLIDEVQDLTEKEILFFMRLLDNPLHFFVSGDINQTINATYFAPHRIHTLLIKSIAGISGKDYEYMLHLNYRCAPPIVKLANALIDQRKISLQGDKHNHIYDEHDVAVMPVDEGNFEKPVLLNVSEKEKNNIMQVASKRHYAAILVNDIKSKMILAEKGIKDNVFTVAEIKGIERDEIICWNLISDNQSGWEKIIRQSVKEADLYRYRYFFNVFYVAITRACERVVLLEDETCKFYQNMDKYITIANNIALLNLKIFRKKSSPEEFYQEAQRLETNEIFDSARRMYLLSGLLGADNDAYRCECYLKARHGQYLEAANGLWRLGEYAFAYKYYLAAKDRPGIVRSEVLKRMSQEEIMFRNDIDQAGIRRVIFEEINDDLFKAYMDTYLIYIRKKREISSMCTDITDGYKKIKGKLTI